MTALKMTLVIMFVWEKIVVIGTDGDQMKKEKSQNEIRSQIGSH